MSTFFFFFFRPAQRDSGSFDSDQKKATEGLTTCLDTYARTQTPTSSIKGISSPINGLAQTMGTDTTQEEHSLISGLEVLQTALIVSPSPIMR